MLMESVLWGCILFLKVLLHFIRVENTLNVTHSANIIIYMFWHQKTTTIDLFVLLFVTFDPSLKQFLFTVLLRNI